MGAQGNGGNEGGARRGCLLVLVAAFLLPQVGYASDDELVEDEVYCEEAVARLQQCCAELPSISCDYRPPSDCSCEECADPGTQPQIDSLTYACLQALSCDAIVAHGYCEDPQGTSSLDATCREWL